MPKLLSPEDYAAKFGRGFTEEAPRAGLGTRFGAAVDRAQAGLYGVGEALGLPLEDQRRENQAQSQMSMERYFQDNPNDPRSFRDIDGVGSLGRYVRGLAIDSAPELLTTAATAGAGAFAGVGALGRLGLATAANYPSAVGDILQNQREESGTADMRSASLLGVPYVAADMLGLDAALASGKMMRTGLRRLDEMKGVTGALSRTGANAALNFAAEGAGETGQELVNQFGRMAVNPDQTLFNDAANERYLESFVGGGLLGSSVSAGMGGWMRSKDYQAPGAADKPQYDLTKTDEEPPGPQDPPLLGLPYNRPRPRRLPPPPGSFQDEALLAFPNGQVAMNEAEELGLRFPNTAGLVREAERLPTDRLLPPPSINVDTGGVAATNYPETLALQDPATELARQQALQKQQELQEAQRVEQEKRAELAAMNEELGIQSPQYKQQHGIFKKLKALKESGAITPEQYTEQMALLRGDKPLDIKGVRTFVKDIEKTQAAAQTNAAAAQAAAPAAPAPVREAPQATQVATTQDAANALLSNAPAPAPANAATAAAPAATPSAPVLGLPSPAPAPAPAPKPPRALNGQGGIVYRVKNALAETGRTVVKGNDIDFTALKEVLESLDPRMHHAIRLALGVDKDGNRLDAPMSLSGAAQKAGIGTSHDKVSKVMAELGLTKEVRQRFTASNAQANERAEGDIGTPGDQPDQDAEGLSEVQETSTRLLSDESTEDRGKETGELSAANGFGQLSNPGGSQGKVETMQSGDIRQARWFPKLVGARSVASLDNQTLAQLVAKMTPYISSPASQKTVGEVLAQVKERSKDPQIARYLRDAITRAYDNEYDATQTPDEVNEDEADESGVSEIVPGEDGSRDRREASSSLSRGDERVDSGGRGDQGGRQSPAPTIVVRKRRTVSKAAQQIENDNVIDVEARVVEETVAPVVLALPEPQISTLERHYGSKRDSAEFLAKVRDDVVNFATKGAEAVSAAIRDIIKAVHAGVLSVAMIFNPTGVSMPEAFAIVPPVQTTTTTKQVVAELPAEVQGMSEAGKQAYGTLIPALKGKNGDKFVVIADKPSGRMFVFDADGQLVVQKKALYGAAKGDLYVGNNDLPRNRVTPAGLFGLEIVDAAKGGSAKVTAGDYDFGKVFSLKDPDAVVTIMHSVWLKEKDAGKRAAALNNDNADDSRYSFGCINVDKATYKFLLDNHESQMDGAKLFVVPDNAAMLPQFLSNTAPNDRLVREGVEPVMETTTTSRELPATGTERRLGGDIGLPKQERGSARAGARVRGMRGRNFTTKDKDGNPVNMKEERLDSLERFNGVRRAIDVYRRAGDEGILDAVHAWFVADNAVGWDGAFTTADGKPVIALNVDALPNDSVAEWAVHHEIGHAVDQVHLTGGGALSGLSDLNVRVAKNRIIPMGPVMLEVFRHYQGSPMSELAKRLAYPLDRTKHGDLDAQGVREEIFAQLWAAYNTPALRSFLEDNLPQTAAFMEDAYETVRQTAYAQANRDAAANGQSPQGQGAGTLRPNQPGQVPKSSVFRENRSQVGSPPQSTIQKNIAKLPRKAQQPVRNSLASIGDMARKSLDFAVFTGDLVKRAVNAGLTSAKQFESLLVQRATKAREAEREVERIADMYALVPEKDRGDHDRSANQFLFESTRTGKWGYGKDADPKMEQWFDSLEPETQAFVRAVFDHGTEVLAQKKKAVLDYTASEYDARLAQARKDGDQPTVEELEKAKTADLKKFEKLFSIRDGKPYAPIKRMGEHVVVAKSAAYRDAEARNDQKELRKLEQDADHYHVSFVDSKNEARILAEQLRKQGFFGTDADAVDHFEREKYQDELFGGDTMLASLAKLRARVDAKAAAGESGASKLQRMVSDLYLQTLAEDSARKSEMRRRGVAGEVDMLRSFAQQGRADAQFMASVQFNQPIQDAIQTMRSEVKRGGNRDRKSELFNELSARYLQALDRQQSPIIDKVTRLASIWYLATSPGYYIQNLTQPWMMSLPAMTGRHDYIDAAAKLYAAYGELKDVVKSGALLKQQFDLTKVPADVRKAIEELTNRGKIDIGMESEMGEFRVEGQGPIRDRLNKADKALRLAVQKVETLNRLSTAMAAYRLEKAKGRSHEEALDYADRILTETHGDYTAFNAPRPFNTKLGKVMGQFRKFQLIQLTYFAKLINDIATNPAERKAALKMLSYTVGHTAVMAGVRGLPGFAAASWLLSKLFGDDDEPFDLEGSLRRSIGDPTLANLIMRGAPTLAGADFSGRVGAGNLLSIMPYSDADLTTASGRAEAVGTLLGGASLGMASKIGDGLIQMLSGEWYRGIETAMPKGVGDAMKAYREAADGMTRRNGDMLLSPDDQQFGNALWQMMGVAPVQKAVVYEQQQRVRDMDQNFQERATRIKNDYAKAMREREVEDATEARQAWSKLQEARQRNGYTKQPLSSLLKAPQEQAKRERNTVGGVQYNRNNRAMADSQV